MGQFLHIPTLLITDAAASACIFVSLVLIWRSMRGEIYILHWSLGYGFATLAMLFVSGRHRLPDVAALPIPGALLLAAFGALWLGYRRFTGAGDGRHDHLWAAAGVLLWGVFSLADETFADMLLRSRLNATIEIVYLLSIAHGLFRAYRASPSPAVGLTVLLIVVHIGKLLVEIASATTTTFGPDGRMLPNGLSGGVGLIESSVFVVFLGVLQLVMIGQRSQERYRLAAETDQLTGLANRRRFLDRVLPLIAEASGRGALILIDVDHFKRVNDTHGHPVGDRTLAAFGAVLARATPTGSIAARVGGEEFALFLPEATPDAAAERAEEIRRAAAALRIATAGTEVGITVSCGVAGLGDTGADYDTLHAAADRALYAAKRDGRDRVAIHRPAREATPTPVASDA